MAVQKEDTKTKPLPGVKKKMGRPPTGKAISGKERKRLQVERDKVIITENKSDEWPERICLMILHAEEKNPIHGYAVQAFKQLGKLRGFL